MSAYVKQIGRDLLLVKYIDPKTSLQEVVINKNNIISIEKRIKSIDIICAGEKYCIDIPFDKKEDLWASLLKMMES